MIEIAITGAAGRMGRRLVALAGQDAKLRVVAAIERPDHPDQGRDAGELAGIGPIGVPLSSDLKATPQLIVDFSLPPSMRHWLKVCRDRRIAMLIGTTGLQPQDHSSIDQAAADIPILQSPNMSVGVNLLLRIAAQMAKTLGDDYDIEISEIHHRFKKDAPSGTAMGLADAILAAKGASREVLSFGREGHDAARRPGQIGVHALRLGDEVGKHTVYFGALGERLELTHTATTRDTFALGALRAAAWLARQKPGRYTMLDMLGL